ncbi:hypothetical protein BGZ95_004890 [Linnemannia exigua]|uniref:Uncharacterized protein n=1 Tax=Linnemannia exigua TaxID=604196 RepID=A0AAD4H979_9FUNG|nr:hypothetical protein BGZ95_004890 [Linnemannia exigua]
MPTGGINDNAKDDPVRDWLSSLGSGIELLLEALRSLPTPATDSSTKHILLKLSFRCLILHTILSLLSSLFTAASTNIPGASYFALPHTYLIYPYIFFYRYLFPKRWDQLFMSTVRSLNCANRSDIVAKPGPRYFVQLKNFLRRFVKAHVELKAIHWLVQRAGAGTGTGTGGGGGSESFFYYPSAALALLASYTFLKSKKVVLLWKLVLVFAFVVQGGNLDTPIWFVQTIYLQEWFLYELLQPYLSRVQFKPWEEQAWLDRYQTELYGFVLAGWVICQIPWIGVAALPCMFPAVAFLLTKSCGSMENSSQGRVGGAGDLIERRAPGVKLVAQGNHAAVRGDWEAVKVLTMVQADPKDARQAIRSFKPQDHNLFWKNSLWHYSVDGGHQTTMTREQVEQDRIRSQLRREALYHEAEREAARQFHSRVGGGGPPGGFGRGPPGGFGHGPPSGWDMRMDPRFSMLSATMGLPSSSPSSTSSSTAVESSSSSSPIAVSGSVSTSISTPSTSIHDPIAGPIASSSKANKNNKNNNNNNSYQSMAEDDLTRYNFSDRKTFSSAPSAPREEDLLPSTGTRIGSRAGGQNSVNADNDHRRQYLHTESGTTLNDSNNDRIREEENKARLRENMLRAKENLRDATQQLHRAQYQTASQGGGERCSESDEQFEDYEDDQEYYEDQGEKDEEEEEHHEDNAEPRQQLAATRGFGFSRGDRGSGGRRGERGGMFKFPSRGGRGDRRQRGMDGNRGFVRGLSMRGQERGRWGRGPRYSQSQSQSQGQSYDDEQGRGYDHHHRSRSISDRGNTYTPISHISSASTPPNLGRTQSSPPLPPPNNNNTSTAAATTSSVPDFSYFSETITQGMAQFEQQLNQRMNAWGNQWAQKIRDAVTDPDNPNVFHIKYER